MGNFHCVPNGCGRVVYREYLPPVIRYRYENEEWQYIEGDDFELNKTKDCTTLPWTCTYSRINIELTNKKCEPEVKHCDLEWKFKSNGAYTTFFPRKGLPAPHLQSTINFYAGTFPNNYELEKTFNSVEEFQEYESFFGNARLYRKFEYITVSGNLQIVTVGTDYGTRIDYFDVNPDREIECKQICKFVVYKRNNIVHEETRDRCPEVEKLPCRLSDETKVITIDKLPFLEKIEVVPYQYSAYRLPGIPAPIPQADPIPKECLNIYKNAIFVIPPNKDALRDPDAVPFNSFVAQICSPTGCPPPEYQVICDCDCEKCPDGTCPIECEGVICCYDNEGKSIKSIEIENYCGGTP